MPLPHSKRSARETRASGLECGGKAAALGRRGERPRPSGLSDAGSPWIVIITIVLVILWRVSARRRFAYHSGEE
jgi:hypothetical protein